MLLDMLQRAVDQRLQLLLPGVLQQLMQLRLRHLRLLKHDCKLLLLCFQLLGGGAAGSRLDL